MNPKKSLKIEIQRFYCKTLIKDCSKELWSFLGVSYEEAHGIDWRTCAKIEDFGEVWMVKITNKKRKYFNSKIDALNFISNE